MTKQQAIVPQKDICIRCETEKICLYFATLEGYRNYDTEYADAYICIECIRTMVGAAIDQGLIALTPQLTIIN